MYSGDQIAHVAEQIQLDQDSIDVDRAAEAAKSIGISVWGYAHNADYNGEEFVERSLSTDASDIAGASRMLSNALNNAAKAMDVLRHRRIDGHDAAVPLLAQGLYKGVQYYGQSTPLQVHENNRGRRIAARAFELLDQREMLIEHYAWPSRVREMARGVHVPADMFVSRVLNDLAHDLEVGSAFYGALADLHENKHGAQTSPGPVLIAGCVMAWFDATEKLPSAHVRMAPTKGNPGKNARSRPDLFELIVNLHGGPPPRGLSREMFRDVVSVLSDEEARHTFRYQYRIKLPGRQAPHEY
jgi:hypothetical protein